MEKVAEHINEMQRIHEEYGAIFDHLFRQHQKSCKQVSEKPSDFICGKQHDDFYVWYENYYALYVGCNLYSIQRLTFI